MPIRDEAVSSRAAAPNKEFLPLWGRWLQPQAGDGRGANSFPNTSADGVTPTVHTASMTTKRRRPEQTARARNLRRNMTFPEVLLWMEIKNKKLGVKFRRQVPIGPYVADCACFENRLIVELDGSQHVGSPYDQRRDRWLSERGYQVARISNSIVYEDVEDAVAMIRKHL